MKRLFSILLVFSLMLSSTYALASDVTAITNSTAISQSLSADEIAFLEQAQVNFTGVKNITAGEMDSNVAIVAIVVLALGALLYVSYH